MQDLGDNQTRIRLEDLLVSESASTTPTLLVCGIQEHERPLKGAAGEIDWRLKGFLSRFLIRGHITGKTGEVTYVPVIVRGTTRHILLVGTHENASARENQTLFGKINATMKNLNLSKVALSVRSFPKTSPSEIAQHFSNVQVEIAQ
ncbi:MAG TPA: M17 family peptidase N-terminal domain-containing protein [Oligoflexia bacterium]|nr:M17 family peptidase N-terminal domain-containing protein [Oligoflexia bacterium]